MQYVIFAARIEDDNPGHEHDAWTVHSQSSDELTLLRADRWHYKNMDKKRNDPECSGVQLFKTVHMIYTFKLHIQYLIQTPHTQTKMVFSGIQLKMWARLKEHRFITQ
jgi:hypothetical protein